MILDDSELDYLAYSPVCIECKNIKSLVDRTCKAFPKGIPIQIWNGKNNHTKPYKGDNGIRFEARKR